jgi:hypothetical protein
MKTIIGITSALFIAVLSVAYLYFSNLNVKNRSNNQILSEIPSDASVIFQHQNDQSLYDIFKDYTIFDTIVGPQKKEDIHWLTNYLMSTVTLKTVMSGQKVFLSFHPSKTDSVDFLWSMQLKEKLNKEDIRKISVSAPSNQILTFQETEQDIFLIKNKTRNRPFYFAIVKGIVRGSFNKDLLFRSLDKNSEKIDPEFIKTINEGVRKDENALVNLFINYNRQGFLQPFFRNNLSGNFEILQSFSGFSSLSLNYKNDDLIYNGLTSILDKKNNYTRLFLNQTPVKNTIKTILPYNTSNALVYGLSSYTLFHDELSGLFKDRKELDTLNKQMGKITSETGVNPDRDLQKLWGNELSTIQLSTYENLAIIKVTNGTQMQFFLEPLSSTYSETIRKINFESLFYNYWGDPLKKYAKPFYMISDNLLILSNSPGTLQRYLKDYNSEKFLLKTESFRQFDQLVGDQSNISFILHFSNSASILKNLLKRNYAENFGNDKHGIKDLYALSYQLASNKDHFFTNFYTGYKKSATTPDAVLSVDSIKNKN